MKKLILLSAVATALVLGSCGGNGKTSATATTAQEASEKVGESYAIALDSSKVDWKAFHKGGFAPRWGTINIQSGDISVQDGEITGGDFVLDMKTIKVDAASVTEADKKAIDLENHLKSADFFHVDSIPTAEFVVTKVEALATAPQGAIEGANKTVSGNLTLLGNTINVSFPAKVEVSDNVVSVAAHFTVNRTDWGIKFGTNEVDPAEWMISKDIEVGIDVKATK